MPPISNPKHERFAQALKRGETASEAFIAASLEPTPFDAPHGCYVYLLVDPRTDRVFYVGKGTGKRALHHGAYAHKRHDLKSATINAIRALGRREGIYVLADDMSRQLALRLERMIIVRAHQHLTNISLGEMDGVERVARTARENLAQIKPLCVFLREKPDSFRKAAWTDVISSLARIAQKAA